MKAWQLYRDNINHKCLHAHTDLHNLDYWRNKLFATMMVYCVPLGLIAVIPAATVAFLHHKLFLAYSDVATLTLLFMISFSSRLNVVVRKSLFIAVLYILSTVLIYYVGAVGSGLMYLLLITIFCSLIFSNRAAYISIAINSVICLSFGAIIYSHIFSDSFVHEHSVGQWFATSINLLAVSTLLVLLLPVIFTGLYKSNERYEMVSKATSDIICDWDLENDTTVYSDNICDMCGYAPADIETNAQWWWSKVHPDDKERVDKAVYNSLQNGALHLHIEYRFRCYDGSYKYILDRAYVLRDTGNKAIRVIGTMQDISQQKAREQRLRLMESVITNATDAVLIAEAETNTDEKGYPLIIYANQAYAEMAGYDTTEELTGLSTQVLHGPASDPFELSRIKAAIESGESYKGEIINYKKNGQPFWNNKTFSPVKDVSDRFTHWISIERDVTERNNYIKAIEDQNKKLKEISWTQSHIVRAPLTRIMGLVNLLVTLPPESINNSEVLEYIMLSAVEFDGIIRDMILNAESDVKPDDDNYNPSIPDAEAIPLDQ